MSTNRKVPHAASDVRLVPTHDGRILTLGYLVSRDGPKPPVMIERGTRQEEPDKEVPSESAPKKWRHRWEKPSPSGSLEDYRKYVLDGMPQVRKDAELDRIAEENKMRILGAMNQTHLSWEQVVAVYRPARKNAMRKQRGMDRKSEKRERKSESVHTVSLEALQEREYNTPD